jgi:hypothetical protein
LLAGLPISQGLLAPGASTVLSYTTTVSAVTSAASSLGACGGPLGCPSILAYSGFGDPIGKSAGAKGVSDPNFPQFELSLPTFNPTTGLADGPEIKGIAPSLPVPGQTTAQTAANFFPIPSNVLGPVPEPETWVLMIIGLGGVGAALRRGRRHVDRLGHAEV